MRSQPRPGSRIGRPGKPARAAGRLAARLLGAGLLLAGLAPPAGAQGDAHGPTGVTVSRRVTASGPRATAPLVLAVGTGYGYTEPVLGLDDRHHRLLGALLGEFAFRPWLGLGLRLDGRYDRHAFGGGRPSDDGWVGEPRVYARVDRGLGRGSVGGRATLIFPGADAPSIDAGAVSGELTAFYTRVLGRLTLSANAGYHLDRSGNAAKDAERLSPADRLALGVSDLDAATVGGAGHYQLGKVGLFAELTWDVLLGAGAPGAGAWPLRLGAGARRQLTQLTHVEVMLEASPSRRPAQGMGMPLVAVPPRVAVLAELVLALGGPPPEGPRREPDPVPADPRLTEVPLIEVELHSSALLPIDAQVLLQQGGEERAFTRGPDGRFSLTGARPGPATVVASARGFRVQSESVRLTPGKPAALSVNLERELPSGQIRGTVRAFDGRPLTANVRLQSRESGAEPTTRDQQPGATVPVEEQRSVGGSFLFDVPPGRYRVTIGAPGHDPQTRLVEVEHNGVTVLNVDLRRAR